MPAAIPDDEPEPEHESTCTVTTSAFLATPNSAPTLVDAQCVPWSEHEAVLESITPSKVYDEPHALSAPVGQPADQPACARPPKSVCEIRIPVSRM